MLLSEFNQGDKDTVEALLKSCVHIDRWRDEILQQRPFKSSKELQSSAEQNAKTWTWSEILEALNTHPRIGEKKAQYALNHKEQNFSNREQASLSNDQNILTALEKGNLAYEKKYGYIFLIKASGLTSEQVLTALNYRLSNDPDIEKRIVHQQLLEIALLRLSQEIEA